MAWIKGGLKFTEKREPALHNAGKRSPFREEHFEDVGEKKCNPFS